MRDSFIFCIIQQVYGYGIKLSQKKAGGIDYQTTVRYTVYHTVIQYYYTVTQ